ncbi:polysialyltransferase family glycosyltransferase, partial [Flavobacterium sp. ACAM 123]|uniref:polysialyltransferase family glycosyltransferase n=1 Tax=Flavobacterium sp. ACAM 123 TaxID=1189620 RepID=UPI00054D9893
MKHIFTIHSPITFLMAIAVIKTNNLKDDEILILTSGYDPIINLPYVKKSFDSINRSLIEKIRYWNTPKESDKYINSFLEKNENFVAYIDLMHMHQRILITNKNCLNFSFIEEGTASYLLPNTVENVGYLFKNNKDRFNKISDLIRDFRFLLRGYTMKIISMSFTPQSYNDIAVKYYCLSDAAYP